jgi:hypothetical protein
MTSGTYYVELNEVCITCHIGPVILDHIACADCTIPNPSTTPLPELQLFAEHKAHIGFMVIDLNLAQFCLDCLENYIFMTALQMCCGWKCK